MPLKPTMKTASQTLILRQVKTATAADNLDFLERGIEGSAEVTALLLSTSIPIGHTRVIATMTLQQTI